MKYFRIIIDIILFCAVFWFPWWLTFVMALIALFFFDSFYEIIVVGLMIDSLYGVSLQRFYHIQFVVTIGALILFILVQSLRKRLRIYS